MQDSPVICVTEYMPGGDLERYYIAAWHQRPGCFEGDLRGRYCQRISHHIIDMLLANTCGLTRLYTIALSYLRLPVVTRCQAIWVSHKVAILVTISFYTWERNPLRGGGKPLPHHVWNIWQLVISEVVFLVITSPCLSKLWESEENIALNMRRTCCSGPLNSMQIMECVAAKPRQRGGKTRRTAGDLL